MNSEKAKCVLKLIPTDGYIGFSFLKELAEKWCNIKNEDELKETISQLMKEGLIYEVDRETYKRVETKTTDLENEEKKKERKMLNFPAKLRITKKKNYIEAKIYIPANYLKAMLGLKKKLEREES
jgi:predicted transcriptional regulator